MNYTNPMLEYQRNNLLAQQQAIQSQLNQLNAQRQPSFTPYPPQQTEPFFIKSVGSIDEAKGYPVDPATIYLFPDTGTGKIYLKRLNTDNGKSELITYTPEHTETQSDPLEKINARLDVIEKKIGGLYESVSGSTNSNTVAKKPVRSNATENAPKHETAEPSKVSADS